MATIRDVVAYFCFNYPNKQELSRARLTKMVYLADWRFAMLYGEQMTDIAWYFNYYGPFVPDVVNAIASDPSFAIVHTTNYLGGQKQLISLTDYHLPPTWHSLGSREIEVLDHVIRTTSPLYWNDFIRLVYSTYPIMSQERMTILDLVSLAKEYQASDGGA